MKRSHAQTAWLAGLAFGLSLTAACTKKEEPAPGAASNPATAAAAAAAAVAPPPGVNPIKGKIKLTGAPPEMKMLRRQSDPFCGRVEMKDEEVIVGPDGGLKNVLVRLTKGVTGSYPPPAAPALVDQSECMFRPRVQAIMEGQPVTIKNSDQTLHNVHAYKGESTLFNHPEIQGMAPIVKYLDGVGQVIKFVCNVHPWMVGYVAISGHPFFAVTGADGSFTIPGVPAGTYTLEAWHERFGRLTTEVTVSAERPGAVDLTFGGAVKAAQ